MEKFNIEKKIRLIELFAQQVSGHKHLRCETYAKPMG